MYHTMHALHAQDDGLLCCKHSPCYFPAAVTEDYFAYGYIGKSSIQQSILET